MSATPGLDIRIRAKRFGANTVLTDVSIAAAAGEFIALVGPSGAGKSTLLNMVAGLDGDYDGDIRWNAAPLADALDGPLRLGMMFQEPRLMPWLSALDNVRLVEKPDGDGSRARALLESVGLGAALDAWPAQLSGGMQRRVALARAFAVAPNLLLMDEPFVSLDMPTGNHLRRALLQLCAREKPLVLFVTHDLREALALADRVIFLGGTPARVLLDHEVGLERGLDLEGPAVAAAQQALLARHPHLLSGMLDDAAPDAGATNEEAQ